VSVERDYIRLGLRLGRHVDGLVDSYYGPPELREEVESEPLRDPAVLVVDAGRLLDRTDGWLRHQVVGLETVARKLADDEIPYAEEVERCYGVRPRRVDEEVFASAHASSIGSSPAKAGSQSAIRSGGRETRCRPSASGRRSKLWSPSCADEPS
jgi:hypothetical protein